MFVMKKSMLYLLLFATTINIANAQIKGGAGFFKTGYLFAPGSSAVINKILSSNSGATSNSYMIIGIEGYYRTGKSIISWDGYAAQQAVYSLNKNFSIEPFITSAQVKLGRIVKENRQYWLYPSVGLGAAAMTLYPSANAIKSTVSNVTPTLLTPSLDIGINGDIFIEKVLAGEKRYGGSMLGIRAGYRISAKSSNWTDGHSNTLVNMPTYSNNCFYVTVGIGAGGFVRK
jgi:hypothetical protein